MGLDVDNLIWPPHALNHAASLCIRPRSACRLTGGCVAEGDIWHYPTIQAEDKAVLFVADLAGRQDPARITWGTWPWVSRLCGEGEGII